MLHEVFAVHLVLLPVLDGLSERVGEKLHGVLRIVIEAKYVQQIRRREDQRHPEFGPPRRLEHGFPVFPELRVRIVDDVQLEAERAAPDHVRRILGHHLTDLDPVRSVIDRFPQIRQQAVAALLHLSVHVFQLVRRKRGRELLPHRLPPFAARKEYVIVQRVRLCAGVHTAVREIAEVFDQYVTCVKKKKKTKTRRFTKN